MAPNISKKYSCRGRYYFHKFRHLVKLYTIHTVEKQRVTLDVKNNSLTKLSIKYIMAVKLERMKMGSWAH